MTVTLLFTRKEGQWDLCLCRHIPGSWAAAPPPPSWIEEASQGVRRPPPRLPIPSLLIPYEGRWGQLPRPQRCAQDAAITSLPPFTRLPSGLCDLSTCSRHETRPLESKPPQWVTCVITDSLSADVRAQPVNRSRALTPGCPSS